VFVVDDDASVRERVVMNKAPNSNRRFSRSSSGYHRHEPTGSWRLVSGVIYLFAQTASKSPFIDPTDAVVLHPSASVRTIVAATVLLPLALTTAALAQEGVSLSAGQIDEIIVTAKKWEQSANTVGMPITAVTGDVLQERGISSVADLTRLVPGFTIQQSSFNSTSFTLRGVGFFNSDLATPPAVTIYVDEAPLPYPAMTKLAAFDLARVEVLKGPQGTLFGQNATGGAINYIAAKPTEAFAAGVDASYGRFNRLQVGGFVSGPITNELEARIAVQAERGDPWQESITRQGDELGKIRELQGRATLEWHPDAQFASRLTFTSTYDGSDSLAAQFIYPTLSIPALAVPGLLTFPVVNQPRAADWSPLRPDTNTPFPYASDTTLYQVTWRNDYRPREDVTFTSLTSYASFRMAYGQDPSGTPFFIDDVIDRNGRVSAFYQELRVAGRQGKINWLLGANYSHDDVKDEPLEFFGDEDLSHLFQSMNPQAYGDESLFPAHMRANTSAGFGRIEYNVTDRLMLEGGVRYNSDRRTFDNCSIAVTNHFASFWNLFREGAQPPTQVGDCYVLDPANGLKPVDDVHNALDQDSVSWRTGLNWTAQPGLLLYANVSKGYKAGAAPVLAASTVDQFKPVPRESLLAYEAGFKASLFDRRVQFNVSAFYYDYKDKQLRGAELDPVFGPLEALVSIPKSHVEGVEAQLIARPIDGLTLDTSATYVETAIDQFIGFNALAHFGNQARTPFPFTPEWQSITNIDYAFPLSPSMKGFVGGSLTYSGKSYAGVGELDLLRIDSFSLLDLRAGLELSNGHYRAWVWGKNVTNEYYWSNVFTNGNAIARFVGQPATYGVSFSARL
jgi:iron complex outermembrane receptor protein